MKMKIINDNEVMKIIILMKMTMMMILMILMYDND